MPNGRHVFLFEGGDKLTSIGATFFVSYLYHQYVDSTHNNWTSIKTKEARIGAINGSKNYHRNWLQRIGNMNEANLNKNTLGISGTEVKEMALKIQQSL